VLKWGKVSEPSVGFIPVEEAAPDLLEVLELVVAQFEGIADDKWATEGIRVAIEKARAAIAKARGGE